MEEQINLVCPNTYFFGGFWLKRSSFLTRKWTSSLKGNFLKHNVFLIPILQKFGNVQEAGNSPHSHLGSKTIRH